MPIKLLIVEDDPDHALFTKVILERSRRDFQIEIITDPAYALRKIISEEYDLILSDYRMPGLNALDLLKRVRSQDKDVPFIIVTASGNEKAAVELMKAGAYDYVLKDLSYEDSLPVVIDRTLEVYRAKKNREELEKQIRKAAEEWQATFDSIVDLIAIHDKDFNIVRVNETFTRHFNKAPVEFNGKKCYQIVHKSESPRDDCPGMLTLKTKKAHTIEFFEPHLEIFFECNTSPIIDSQDNLIGIVHVLRDITSRKQAEKEIKQAYKRLKETQNELVQSEKMAALGRFASGVAHEVKNPLGVILGGIEFLEGVLSTDKDDISTALEKIKEATLRADTIIRNLLRFARPSELTVSKVSPVEIIEDTLALIQYKRLPENIEIRKDFSREEFYIKVDKNQMQQVVFNLLNNAIESIKDSGKIIVKTYKQVISEFMPDKPCCVIEVIDSGKGILEKDLSLIFEPFFTTKRDKKGIGLGLYMTKVIVDNHKGILSASSIPGKGSSIKVILPLSEEKEI